MLPDMVLLIDSAESDSELQQAKDSFFLPSPGDGAKDLLETQALKGWSRFAAPNTLVFQDEQSEAGATVAMFEKGSTSVCGRKRMSGDGGRNVLGPAPMRPDLCRCSTLSSPSGQSASLAQRRINKPPQDLAMPDEDDHQNVIPLEHREGRAVD
jgi:hypothetical protein